ncbi:MAG: methylmalonyl-CoA mutase family protein [Acidimicrobiales bacterium]
MSAPGQASEQPPRSEGRSGPPLRSEGRSGPPPRSEGRSGPPPRSEVLSGRPTITTESGIPLRPVYGPPGAEVPGTYPYTRGPYASMYRGKLWTMRMFAGFGTATDTNARFRQLLESGSDGLSTAFDLPTLMGCDSDDPRAEGEIGRGGVAVDTLADVADLYAGIDLGSVTTSMTVNGPAAVLLAMYVAAAESAGVARADLGGTVQNDILKEYQAQKEYLFPPRPSMRLATDLVRFCAAEMPRWYPVSVSGYHIREAGATAVQELAFTLGNGFAYVEAAMAAGMAVDDAASRLSFFFNAHLDLFEEVAKFRAARRLWAVRMHDRYGARRPRALQCRFHAQTSGASLAAQQPELNLVRTAVEALGAVLGGAQSLHTNGLDEVYSLPTDRASRLALRTQQVIAHETGVPLVADPLGGSWLVESLTDEMEHRAAGLLDEIDRMGGGSMLEGVHVGIEDGWFQSHITDASYAAETAMAAGDRVVVGVNRYTEGDDHPIEIHEIAADVEERQLERLAEVRAGRDGAALARALSRATDDARRPDVNLLPAILDAVRAYATVGEVVDALAPVFGRWTEDPVL